MARFAQSNHTAADFCTQTSAFSSCASAVLFVGITVMVMSIFAFALFLLGLPIPVSVILPVSVIIGLVSMLTVHMPKEQSTVVPLF